MLVSFVFIDKSHMHPMGLELMTFLSMPSLRKEEMSFE